MYSLLELEGLVRMPGSGHADMVLQVLQRIDRGIDQHRAAAEALGQPGRVEAAQRGADDGQLVFPLGLVALHQRQHQFHRRLRRGRQLRADQLVRTAALRHALVDHARLEGFRRGAEAVQI
jgi:hypothetical protein